MHISMGDMEWISTLAPSRILEAYLPPPGHTGRGAHTFGPF